MAPVQALGGILSGFSTIVGGAARASAARRNFAIAQKNAKFVELQTEEDIELFESQFDDLQASVRTNIAGSGRQRQDANNILASNAIKAERDIAQLRLKGEREAEIVRAGGQAALRGGTGEFLGGFLTAGGQIAGGVAKGLKRRV